MLDAIPVGRVIDSGKVHASKTYEGHLEKILEKDIPFALGRTGSSFALGPAMVKILWPDEKLSDNLNDCSIVVRVIYGKFSALLAGDIEAGAEQTLVRGKMLSPAVVLKVAHHGSGTSTTSAFLAVLRPAIAIISAGAGNTIATATLRQAFSQGSRRQARRSTGLTLMAPSASRPMGRAGRLRPDKMTDGRRRLPLQRLRRLAELATNTSGAGTRTCSTTRGASIKPANLRVFNSRKEAIDKGYRPCKVCKP